MDTSQALKTSCVEKLTRKPYLANAAVIGTCFLLTSTAYLAWTYHIMELTKAPLADAVTLIAAYLFQAAGLGLFAFHLHRRKDTIQVSLYIVLALHMLCVFLSVLCVSFVQVIVFGCLQNMLCGWIAGYYLYRLASSSDASHAAVSLGIGYSAAIVASWLLSAIGKGSLNTSAGLLMASVIFTVMTFCVIRMDCLPEETPETENHSPAQHKLSKEISLKQILIPAGALILLFSVINSCGFGFPSTDVANGISVEFSRLFYAAGLLIAGLINDKNRRYGAVCAVIALIIPFFMLAIREEPISRMVFWALSYFTFGFYSVYRIILFSDISRGQNLLPLCGFGLLVGRIGDAVGELLCLTLAGHYLILIGIVVLLFMISMVLFFRIYRTLYLPEPKRQKSEQEIFDHFSDSYNLSAREREVLRLLLDKKTNQEIAEELFITDGTVKYHIHNLLQKTDCPNRLKLLSVYASEKDA